MFHLLDPPKTCASQADAPSGATSSKPSFVGALARLFWMLVGNAGLFLVALAIAEKGSGGTWTADVAFWAVVASLVLVRHLDIARLGGATASGSPASLRDWYRYTGWLLLVASVVWLIAHAVALVGF
jgi:hypothetical protein